MWDNRGPTKLIKEGLHIEQHGMAQDLIGCLLGYILATGSCKLIEAGMCTRPSQEEHTEAVEDLPIAEYSIRKPQISCLLGQWAHPLHLSMWAWPHAIKQAVMHLGNFDPEIGNHCMVYDKQLIMEPQFEQLPKDGMDQVDREVGEGSNWDRLVTPFHWLLRAQDGALCHVKAFHKDLWEFALLKLRLGLFAVQRSGFFLIQWKLRSNEEIPPLLW